ncbi:MAG TPA: hypothetical protein DCP92_10800 [Nitrospiraceae bacterium]|jgi:hypothetical protein|nr:hypothetical protein [Nitrospiraceae bacterium]
MPDFPIVEGDGVSTRVAIEHEDQDEGLQNVPAEHRGPVAFGMEVGLRPNETLLSGLSISLSKKVRSDMPGIFWFRPYRNHKRKQQGLCLAE